MAFARAVTQLLPYAMGIRVSRRTFHLATALVAVAQAFVFGVALAAPTEVEGATRGWGTGLEFWAPAAMDVDNFALPVMLSGAPMLALMSIGIGMGGVHERWGQAAVWGLILGTLVLFDGAAVLLTGLGAWGSLARWLGDRSVTTLVAGFPLLLAVAVAGLSWLGLRRVVP